MTPLLGAGAIRNLEEEETRKFSSLLELSVCKTKLLLRVETIESVLALSFKMELKVPRFFKVLLPGFHARLRLPPIISRKLGEKEARKVKLITKEGIFVVTIQKLQDGRLWFTNGWHAFVLKHGLVAGQFITFKHMGSSIFKVKVLRFFKVLLPGFDCLRLPPKMSWKLGEKGAKKAVLITKKGTSAVTIQESQDGGLWFTNGWHAFVLKHGLAAGDFITFKCMGSSNFKVTVYTLTCCEKDFIDEIETEDKADTGVNNATPSVKSEAEEVPPHTQHHFHMSDGSDARKFNFYGREEDDQNIYSAKLNPINKKHFEESAMKVERDEDIITYQLNDNFPAQDGEKGLSPSTTRSCDSVNRQLIPFQVYDGKQISLIKPQNNDIKSCSAKLKMEGDVKKVDVKSKKVPKVNTSSPEQNLQFSLIMKSYHLRHRSPYMHVPAGFCVANDRYQNARLTLRGPMVEQEVSLRVCRGGSTKYAVITRGWLEFIAGNKLGVGDTCLFKLQCAGTSSAGVVLDVEVVPA
ncbi:unnamed protein product [Cuscuta epithymum]|uniref:TF-B3 domain-containing protein n=2 Tax=Cuscuta epithymum TaxID=186058 RepID=A0AAV0GIR5_9ASTE|nr:unnamed protein product [Cuscuta epithymum]